MRKFILKSITFSLLFISICWVIELSGIYTKLLPNRRVYSKIELSKKEIYGAQILLMGDSVAGSTYEYIKSGENGIVNLACNQAIDVIGHYFLLRNFLEKNSEVKKVFFFYNPFSFSNNIDHIYSYNHFLKPFYKKEYKKYFTDNVYKQIRSYPLYFLARFPPVAINYFAPDFEVEEPDVFISEITREYLQKFVELTREHGIEFEVLSPPLRESKINDIKQFKSKYLIEGTMSDLMDNYFDKISFLPDEYYRDDLHFKQQYFSKGKEVFSRLTGLNELK